MCWGGGRKGGEVVWVVGGFCGGVEVSALLCYGGKKGGDGGGRRYRWIGCG